jgi:hypothetical protein
MKRSFIVIILSFLQVALFGQMSVKGNVKDHHENLPSVNVLLLNQDSIMIDGKMQAMKAKSGSEEERKRVSN